MTWKLTIATVALLLVASSFPGCALTPMHPGRRLVARKCTACHVEPAPEELRGLDRVKLGQIHNRDPFLSNEQMAKVQEYVREKNPADATEDLSD